MLLSTPAIAFVALLLLFAFLPSPIPADIEQDALKKIQRGKEVTRVYRDPWRWSQRSHFALSFAFDTATRSLHFPYCNLSISLVKPPAYPQNVTVRVGDGYLDDWFAPADEVLIWVATRPLAEEEFEEQMPLLLSHEDDEETGEHRVELRPDWGDQLNSSDANFRLPAVNIEPSILTIIFKNSTSKLPTGVYFPTLHEDSDFSRPLLEFTSAQGAPTLADVLAPSATLPFRIFLIENLGAFTLSLGRSIEPFVFLVAWILRWGFWWTIVLGILGCLFREKRRVNRMKKELAFLTGGKETDASRNVAAKSQSAAGKEVLDVTRVESVALEV
ncbi:hypothetical protein P7C70_g4286, partial [Phenoliferia sp. Uapishka_3]